MHTIRAEEFAPGQTARAALKLDIPSALTSKSLRQAETSTLGQVNSFMLTGHHDEKN